MKPLLFLSLALTIHAATPVADIKVPAGFKVELLREAGQREGSWISMALDDAGRIYISPQGSIPESGLAKDSKWGGLWRATLRNSQSQIAHGKDPESGNPSGKEPSSNTKPPASAPASALGDLPSAITQWQKVPVPIGDAMGMLWAFDSLYVSGNGPEGRGIYRCKDTDGDSLPDTAVMWKRVPGGAGEHGAHALVLSPDKKHITIVHGNSTGLIEGIAPDSPYRNWGEDDLLPKLKDPTATFFDSIKAPYGYVVRTDEHGKKWELIAGGLRNPYDIAFNADGELFTYDSDMEWDRGLPWYRPTRVLHIVPGGEYGFREGSAKMPAYYPDTLPAVVDIGLGCPTGVKFGTNAKGWPEKYRRAFFVCDWTYGRILAVHMREKGASYTATNVLKSTTFPKDAEYSEDVEPFVVGKGMAVTDIEFLADGSMVFTTGGRGTSAGLYRVSYVGKDVPPATAEAPDGAAETPEERARQIGIAFRQRKSRAEREKVHTLAAAEGSAGTWRASDALRSEDHFVASAGRQKLESLPLPTVRHSVLSVMEFADVLLGDKHPKAIDPLLRTISGSQLQRLLVLSRVGIADDQNEILTRLKSFPLAKLSDAEKLIKLRILQLTFARHGRPSDEWQKVGLEKLLAAYPAQGPRAAELNRELSQLLVWLSQPELGDLNGSGGTPAADSAPKPVNPTVGDRSVAAPVANPGATVHAGRKGSAFHAELGQQVIEKTLALMESGTGVPPVNTAGTAVPLSQEEQISYALVLRWAHGWTPPQREWYFRWFHEKAVRFPGGNSMQGFIKKIHAEAASRVPADERAPIAQWLAPLAAPAAEALKARPFVKAWTLAELEPALDALKDRKPDLARGKQLYAEAQCARCHLYKDAGGNVGPDLSAVAQRFQRRDILEAILDPNKAVSEQYALTTLTVIKFGGGEEEVTGLLQEETSGTIRILTDSLTGATREFYHNVVKKKDKALVSTMPPALLNTLTAEEVADLLAFLGR